MNQKLSNKIRFLIFIFILVLALYFLLTYLPVLFSPPQPQPVRPHPVQYPYYQIIDQATGKTLTYVSSAPVTIGDEYVTEENRRYIIIRVKGNKAYAKYAGKTT